MSMIRGKVVSPYPMAFRAALSLAEFREADHYAQQRQDDAMERRCAEQDGP
jgi:hypothetical protein